jgi:hypothetical protein
MRFAKAKRIPVESIPVIDIAALIDEALRVTRRFFERPLPDKDSVRIAEKKRGYIEPNTGIMKLSTTKDFRWGKEPLTKVEAPPAPHDGSPPG